MRILPYHTLLILFSCYFLVTHPSPSFAESVLQEYSYKSFKLSVSEDDRQNIVLKVKDPTLKDSSYFTITDPTRFVLDIVGSNHVLNKALTVNHPYLVKVRMGSHPDKNRIVLDMAGNKSPHISFEKQAGSSSELVFHISFDSQQAETNSFAPLKQPTEQPSSLSREEDSLPERIEVASPTPQQTSDPSELVATRRLPDPTPSPMPVTPSPEPTAEQATTTAIIVAESPQPEPSLPEGRALMKIVFRSEKPATVEFLLSKKARFTFVKKSLKEYQLTLHGCGAVEEHLLLPYFPPHTFPGVSFVQAKKQGDSLVLSLQTDHGTRLSPRLNGESVLVEVSESGSL